MDKPHERVIVVGGLILIGWALLKGSASANVAGTVSGNSGPLAVGANRLITPDVTSLTQVAGLDRIFGANRATYQTMNPDDPVTDGLVATTQDPLYTLPGVGSGDLPGTPTGPYQVRP